LFTGCDNSLRFGNVLEAPVGSAQVFNARAGVSEDCPTLVVMPVPFWVHSEPPRRTTPTRLEMMMMMNLWWLLTSRSGRRVAWPSKSLIVCSLL
jgi:hypothetical protein